MLVALALGAAALALPPTRVAEWLVGGAPRQTIADVELGVWLLKGLLALHAGALAAAARSRFPWTATAPLAEGVLSEPPAATRREIVMLTSLLLLALLLRLVALGDGLWFDEIQTLVQSVRAPMGNVIATFQNSNQHALFSLLAKASIALTEESAWALRLPAVLLGVASLAALFWFASMVTSRLEALLAVALLTVSYHHVWFSQNARGYTGLMLWTLLATGLFARMLSSRETRTWGVAAAYALCMALAIYTHLTAVFIVVAHALVWAVLAYKNRRTDIWPVALVPLVALVLAGTLSLLLYSLALPQLVRVMQVPVMEGQETAWKSLGWALMTMYDGLTQGSWLMVGVMAAGALVGLAGVASFWRRHWSLAALMLLPALLTAAALVANSHNLWPRFFFFSAGFAVLIAIRGVFALSPILPTRHASALATAAILFVIAVSASTVRHAWGPKQDYEGARRFVESKVSPDDAVVTLDMTIIPYNTYYKIPWDSVSNGADLESVEKKHTRTWVLYQFPVRLEAVQPTTWARLQERYETVGEFPGTLGGGSIFVKVSE
ncbi:MAG TPA: glycosyltransferase family 39 protein [Gemmatimonadaceae bacterium]|nr:glycosyltransferase family 39 protein [Gemmatimonadaceae bacterium]